MGRSVCAEVYHGRVEGQSPPVDLAVERRAGECIRKLIADGLVTAVHDCSDGGASGFAIAEMALAGNISMVVKIIPNSECQHDPFR